MSEKKLLVFSDSHGDVSAVKAVFAWAVDHLPPKDSICTVAFCGDGLADLQQAADATGFYSDWKLVGGNNDYSFSLASSTVFDFADHRFFMCHGHRHNIYSNFHTLAAAGRASEADIVLFGHAHVPVKYTEDGILIVNPGSISRPRSKVGATFAVIECGEKVDVVFYGIIGRGLIREVKI